MIHFISRYFYTVHRDKVEMLTRAERRQFFIMLSALLLCIITIAIIWRSF